MDRCRQALWIFLIAIPFFPLSSASIQDFRWKNRLLVGNFDRLDETALLHELESVQEELLDRKLRIIAVMDEGLFLYPDSSTTPADYQELRAEIEKLGDPHRWLLIGLDGGIKARYEKLDWEAIFVRIDGMPMRRAEFRRREP